MNINELRNLNRSIEEKKRKKVENSAINLKMDKNEFSRKAVEQLKTKEKKLKRKKIKKHNFNKLKYFGIATLFFLSMIFVVCSLSGAFSAPKPKLSIDSIVTIDNKENESQDLESACKEILGAFRRRGDKGIKQYLQGLPPFVVENSMGKLSEISQYDDIDIVNIKKDLRIDCYHINCTYGIELQPIVLSITKKQTGGYRLVGIN